MMRLILVFLLLLAQPFLAVIPHGYQAPKKVEKIKIILVNTPLKKFPKSTLTKETKEQRKWVDSVYETMTLEEKFGQLFMVAAYSNKKEDHALQIEQLIEQQHIGGVIFFQGGPVRQAKLTNRFQAKSKLPLLVGIDAEWGLSMRLDSTYRYPWNMTLGAIAKEELITKMGEQLAEQCKAMGIHFTFGPVVDVNTNSKNPIIGIRSFGESKENVTNKAIAFMLGLQNKGVFATAKHFPGHGDTDKDSHYTLPSVNHSKERLHSVELYPYQKIIEHGLASVMVAHLNVPALEANKIPSSLSKSIVTDLLQKDLDFKGLILTDALNMKGVSQTAAPGEVDLQAFMAGNDVLLFPENVPIAITKLKEAWDKGWLDEERLAYSVKKILRFKHIAGLHQKQKEIDLTTLNTQLNQPSFDALNSQLFAESITLVKNQQSILPLKYVGSENIAFIKLGDDDHTNFLKYLQSYTEVTEVTLDNSISIEEQLARFTTVIIGYHKSDGAWKNHQFTIKEIEALQQIASTKRTVLVSFAKAYSLQQIPDFNPHDAIVQSYQNHDFAHKATAEVLFGARAPHGVLPVTVHPDYPVGTSFTFQPTLKLQFDVPENVGMDSKQLRKIDSIANATIQQKIAPGMQILVARKGKIVYHKAFGKPTYESNQNVQLDDVYDLASLTKILATLPQVMQLVEAGKIQLIDPIGKHLPELKGTNKENLKIQDILLHQAGLKEWEPFYTKTLDKAKKPDTTYYRFSPSKKFSIKVADNLYLRSDYPDSMFQVIANSKLYTDKRYAYSDFGFILMKRLVEKYHQQPLDVLTKQSMYQRLGANNLGFNAWMWKPKNKIIPSEIDQYFRYQTIHGYVHDMAAAMQGGVDGHAGLFGNALDVAKMMQMFLQNGYYGGNRFFSEEVMQEFNTCFACDNGNRRGLGFDKPHPKNPGNTCGCTSSKSFGHTGFTGTMAWADPEKELVYVFLSNRTYPEAKTNQLSKQNIRENIQKIIYESIKE